MAHTILSLIRNGGSALRSAFEAQALASSRREAIVALQAKSDAELARMGIKRDEIAQHVFRDLFYA